VKCLVLGGGGFLGSHLTEALLAIGHSVRVFEKRGFSRGNLAGVFGDIELIEGSEEDQPRLEEAFRGVDVLFHLAGTTNPATSNQDTLYDVTSNVLPTLRVLAEASRRPLKKLIFFSSGGTVYGIPQRIPIDESHPTNPISSYGIHKLTIEKFLGLHAHLNGLNYVTLRISNAYGERQSPTSGQGVVTTVVHRALRHEPIEVWGDGTAVRDYVHVSDIIAAAIKAAEYEGNEKVFNIGTGVGTSVLDVLRAVENLVGYPLEVSFSAARPYDVPISILDVRLAREEIGWSAKIELHEGLARTLAYARNSLL